MRQQATMDKVRLREIIQANRDKHRTVFLAALDGYRREAILLLEERLAALRDGKTPRLNLGLTVPVDHTSDYDNVLQMLDMDLSDTWTMDEGDFAQYVRDQWQWKRDFLRTSSVYAAGTVSENYSEYDGE